MEKPGEGELIEWSRKLNKLFTYCAINNTKNILFPIFFILEEKTFPKRYRVYDKNYLNENFYYLGIIEISFYDNKKTKSLRKLYSFIYSHQKTNFVIVLDIYSRLVYQGTYMPTTTVTYTEMINAGVNYDDKDFKTILYRSCENPQLILSLIHI